MSTMLGAIFVAVIPPVLIGALLRLSERVQRQRDARFARQIELTDAIHRELGAVAAPTVGKRRGGGLIVRMMVPLQQPELVAAILTVTDQVFARDDAPQAMEIVLAPRPGSASALGSSRSTQKRAVERAIPMIAAAR